MANEYSYMNFLKKCYEFIAWIFSFIRGRKKQTNDQINADLKSNYDKIDKEKEAKREDDVKDRLNNMFKS
jgi:hypothetical protein